MAAASRRHIESRPPETASSSRIDADSGPSIAVATARRTRLTSSFCTRPRYYWNTLSVLSIFLPLRLTDSGASLGNARSARHALGWSRPRLLLHRADLAQHAPGLRIDATVRDAAHIPEEGPREDEARGHHGAPLTTRNSHGILTTRDGSQLPSRSRFLWLCLVGIALLSRATEACAQYLNRPFLDWHTMSTERFTFYYPTGLADWTRDVASRVESIDSAVSRLVGYTP